MVSGSALERLRREPVRLRRFREPATEYRMAEWHLQRWSNAVRLAFQRGLPHGVLLCHVVRDWRALSEDDRALLLEAVLRVPITPTDLRGADEQGEPDPRDQAALDPPTR